MRSKPPAPRRKRPVFTDDVSAYAAAARDIGMHGFHFTGYQQFAADLRSIGLEV